MTKQEIIDYLYNINCRADYKIEDIAEDLASEERPQGEWLLVGHNDTVNFYRCSNCGYEEHDNFTKTYNFCPICGIEIRQN